MQKIDIAELRRLWEAGQEPNKHWADNLYRIYSALPSLLDELEALRADLKSTKATIRIMDQSIQGLESAIGKECDVPQGEAVWKWLLKRDRRMKLIGAAEWLEANNERLDTLNRSDVEEVAAQLRREAEGK